MFTRQQSNPTTSKRTRTRYTRLATTLLLLSALATPLSTETRASDEPQKSVVRLDRVTDMATAELRFTGRHKIHSKRTGVAKSLPQAAGFSQSVIRDRVLRNGSSAGFRQDVRRIESQAQAVSAGWFGIWLRRSLRNHLDLPLQLLGK